MAVGDHPAHPDRVDASALVDSPPRPSPKLKITLPGYKLDKAIARGGQGIVIKAVQVSSGKVVAVKLLNQGPLADRDARSRLQREVAVMAAVNHPNIVTVIDHGITSEGFDYLVMDFVNGKPLYELIQAQSDPLESCPPLSGFLKIFTRICAAMHAAHLHGIVHRDLCPSNILIDAQAEPHILDFGLARTAFDQFIGGGPSKSSTGQFIGKPQYASPEQARGEPDKIDIRTDVYALGVILYQILTGGEFPYKVAGSLMEVLNNIVNEAPTPPSKRIASSETQRRNPIEPATTGRAPAGITRVLEAIVMKALEKDPKHRYQSAGELGRDIENYLAGQPTVVRVTHSQYGFSGASAPNRTSAPKSASESPRANLTRERLVLATLLAGVLVGGWAIFYFVSVETPATDLPVSAESTTVSGPPINPKTFSPPGATAPSSVGPPTDFGLRSGPLVAVSSRPQVLVSHPSLPVGPPIVASGSEYSNSSESTPSPHSNGPPIAVPPPTQKNQPIDLLAIVQASDVLKGKWTRVHDGIESIAIRSELKLRYIPEGEYDLEVVFTCKPGSDNVARNQRGVCEILAFGGHDFGWVMGYDDCWYIEDKDNGSHYTPGLKIGEKHKSVVKVRSDGVSVYLDGAPVSIREGYSGLREITGAAGIPESSLALITVDTPTVFHSIKVTPISKMSGRVLSGPPVGR